jgi:geranylgeranyl pyrophosphate synthase
MPLISFRIFLLLIEKQAITKSLKICMSHRLHIRIGGKRIRPVLTLMTTEVLMEIIKALPAAMAVEVFHNFFWFMMILWMTLLCEEEHDRS